MKAADMVLFGNWIDNVIPFLFVVVWIIVQAINFFRKAAQAMPQGRAPQVRPRLPADQGGPGRPPETDREIEELLRRTLGMEPVRRPPPSPPKQQKKKDKKKQVVAKEAGPTPRGMRDDISRHVEQAFAHDLAHASPSGTALQKAASGSHPADDLIASLRSPENLRRLMMVREILDVPSHRW